MRVGTDIIEIERIRNALDQHGQGLLQRIFTQEEQAYCLGQADPAVHLAARFAAKEAVAKLIGTGFSEGVRFVDISVERMPSGEVQVQLNGTSKQIAQAKGIKEISLSLSHCREYATAVAIAD